jgi:hypothetical protein
MTELRMRSRYPYVLLLAVAALLMTAPGFLPGRILAPLDGPRDAGAWQPDPLARYRVSNSLLSDVSLQFEPWDREVRRQLHAGTFPWRSAFAGTGAPLFANPQVALLSPFTWPRLLLGDRGWAISVFLRLLVAALSMTWLARTAGAERREAMVSGVVFAWSGYLMVWGLYPMANVAALLPALAAASLRLLRRPSRSSFAAVILLAALATAGGHPETLLAGVVAIAALIGWESAAARNVRPLARVAVAAALGFFLLAIQLVPFALLVRDSAARSQRAAGSERFHAGAVVGQFLPGAFGSPLRDELDLTALVPAGENFNTRNEAFVGLLVMLAIAFSFRQLQPFMRRAVVVGIVGLLCSWQLPLLRPLLHAVPLLRIMALEYFSFAAVFGFSLAAGPALVLVAHTMRRRVAMALLLCGLALAIATALAAMRAAEPLLDGAARAGISRLRARGFLKKPAEVYEQRLAGYLRQGSWTAVRRLALPALCWAVFAAGCLKKRSALVIGAALSELFVFGFGYLPAIRADEVAAAPPAVRDLRRLDPNGRWFLAASNDVFAPNLGTWFRVRDVRSYDVLTSVAESERLRGAGFDPVTGTLPSPLTDPQRSALSGLGVRWLLSREAPARAIRVGGLPSPAVGVYELADSIAPAAASNGPPPGVAAGAMISVLALLVAGVVLPRIGKG